MKNIQLELQLLEEHLRCQEITIPFEPSLSAALALVGVTIVRPEHLSYLARLMKIHVFGLVLSACMSAKNCFES